MYNEVVGRECRTLQKRKGDKMDRAAIKKSDSGELIVEYVITYANLVYNINTGCGTKRYSQHCQDLEEELLKRGVLTQENIDILRK
jgi:hypothetical protein